MTILATLTAALIAVDGDTVKIPATGERLRLDGLDAPERRDRAACPPEAALAEAATRRVAELLAAGVKVEDSGQRGKFGRRLVTLRLSDGRTVGAVLISEGLAVPWDGRRHDWCG